MKQARWAVVMTVDEPAALVLANVAWHLGTGAAAVHVYLDRPDDPAAADLAGVPGVVVTRCDAAHWAALAPDGRPLLQMRRQALNANHARAQVAQDESADWIVHLDADEFLLQHAPLARELGWVSGLEHEIRFPVWERAYATAGPGTLFEGVFRGTTRALRPFEPLIVGPDHALMIDGMLGHSEGKCAVPVTGNWRIGIHWSFRGPGPKSKSARIASSSTRLLHFDGLTPLHYLIKLMRYARHAAAELDRLVSQNRHGQIALLGTGPMRLHDRLRVLDGATQDRLAAFGLLHSDGFDPAPVIAGVLDSVPDLSVAGFDAALRRRYPAEVAALERLGL